MTGSRSETVAGKFNQREKLVVRLNKYTNIIVDGLEIFVCGKFEEYLVGNSIRIPNLSQDKVLDNLFL